MLRLVDAVPCDVHHAVAQGCSDKDTDACDEDDGLEGCRLGSDGGVQEVDGIVADAHHKVEYGEDEQEENDSQIDCFHIDVIVYFISVCKERMFVLQVIVIHVTIVLQSFFQILVERVLRPYLFALRVGRLPAVAQVFVHEARLAPVGQLDVEHAISLKN